MKKLFSAFTAVLLAFCFISCAPQEFSGSSSKNNGSVSLLLNAARTISPASGVSYLDVSEWTLTFQDETDSRKEKYNNITQTVSFENNKNVEIPLPIGTYKIIFEGNATKTSDGTSVEVPFYGEDSVTVEKNQTVSKSVFVAPKKSDKGTGSFNFEVITSGFGNNPPNASIGNSFTVSLTPYGGENPTAITWTPKEISYSSAIFESYSFSVLDSVPSGFYTLSIKYTWVVGTDSDGNSLTKTKEIFYPYHDFLVEIIDGLETKGSVDITVSLEESKTYYATIGTSNGNGAFASMPKNFDALLEEIDSSVSFVNIYMVDENPSIDVSRIKKGITYNIYNKNGTNVYLISAETEQIPSVTISGGQAKLIYSGSEETPEINCTLQKKASVLVDSLTINIQYLEDSDYYENNPCVIMQNPDSNVILSESLLALYEIILDQKGTEIKYYITPVKTTPSQTDGFVLYNNTSDATQPLLFYAAFSDEGLTSPQALIQKDSSLKIIDYCFDLTNNLYALVEKTSGSYSVYKYNNAANSYEEYSLSAQDIKNIQCIECSGSSLYAIVETSENEYFAKLTLDDLLKIVKVEQYELTQWILTSSTHNDIKTFCVNGSDLYAVAAFSDSTITKTAIFNATIDESAKNITSNFWMILSTNTGNSVSEFDNYGTNLEYRDLCYINKNLYLLIRDVQQHEDSAEAITSRGAVCIYKLSDNSISQGDIIGYQEQEVTISYTSDVENNSTTERQTYIGDGISTFCGPVKFVSFNESALFIADNGFSLKTEAYSRNENHTQCTATSKNSIVTFDLSSNDLSFKSLEGECFDKNYSGYFYGTSFIGNE
ncbi:MAG: hypothetical protein PUD33_05310 [Treponema sp.]|nr:hypothetical protein [Treponema sp.]